MATVIKTSKTSLNLLHATEPPKSFWEKAYIWVARVSSIVIMICSVIVISISLFKLTLAFQNNQLKDNIASLNTQIDGFKEEEAKLKNLQANLSDYSIIWKNSSNFTSILDTVFGLNPNNNKTVTMTLDKNKMSFAGIDTKDKVEQLENKLKTMEIFKNTVVNDFSSVTLESNNQGKGGISKFNFSFATEINKILEREDITSYGITE